MKIRIKEKNRYDYEHELQKVASGTGNQSLYELINQEAFQKIIQKFPELSPYIVGIDVVEQISDHVVLATAIIFNGESKLVIPVVYSNGNVDATTFIYEPETDNMLALTKKTINFLMNKNKKIGYSADTATKQIDTGNIRKLFIPPKNWSPKVATGGKFFIAVETNKNIKEAFLNKIATDKNFRSFFEDVFGDDKLPYVDLALEKTANHVAPQIGTINDIDGWLHKEAAMQEIAMNGIAISHGTERPSKSLIKYTNYADMIRSKYGIEELEELGKREGSFLAFNKKTLSLEPLINIPILSMDGHTHYSPVLCGCVELPDKDIAVIEDNTGISKSLLVDFNPQNFIKHAGNRNVVFMKGGKPWRALDYMFRAMTSKMEALVVGEDTYGLMIRSMGTKSNIVIEKNSDREPTYIAGKLLIGDNNVKIYTKKPEPEQLVSITDLTMSIKENTKLVKVAYDGANFYYQHKSFNKVELADKLLKEGYDKGSIHALLKVAAQEGQVSMQAIDAKFDVLTKMIMNLTGEIKKVENKINTQTPTNQVSDEQANVSQQDPNAQAQQQAVQEAQDASMQQSEIENNGGGDFNLDAQAQQQAQQDPNAQTQQGTPLEQALQDPNFSNQVQQMCQQLGEDPNQVLQAAQQQGYTAEMVMQELEQAMQQAQAQQQAQQDPNAQAQQQAQAQQDPDAQAQQQAQLQGGMNTRIDPNVLNILKEIKDSPIMDTTLFSMVLANKNIALVIEDQLANILNGVSGMGRVLFNIKLNQDSLEQSMGSTKFKNMVSNLTGLFTKTTDFYVDLLTKKQQFKTEE